MPTLGGLDAFSRMTKLKPDLKAVFMSGYAHPVLANQGTLDPGVILLEKPFTESGLLTKIKEVLDLQN